MFESSLQDRETLINVSMLKAPPTPEELLRILHSGTNVSRQENERMKRQLRALSAAWINRTNVDDDIPPGISPDLPVMEASAMRLELAGLRMLAGKPQSKTDAYINVMMESDPSIGLGLRCAIYKDRGHQHFKDGKYLEAVDMYKEGMRQILGKDTVLPSTEYLNKKYMDLKEGDWRLYIDLMECCERISACYERMNKPVEVGVLVFRFYSFIPNRFNPYSSSTGLRRSA